MTAAAKRDLIAASTIAMTTTPLKLDDTALSFEEWKASGHFVIKGSKSQIRDINGVPQFTADQVCATGDRVSLWSRVQEQLRREKTKPAAKPWLRQPVVSRKESRSGSQTMWEKSADRAQKKGTPFGVVEDFDSFVREAGMLPDLSRRTRFAINDPLEMHFMEVADKHGILDGIIDGDMDDWY